MKCFCVMAFVARCAARWCRGETHRLITSFHAKMVVVITHQTFKFSVPQITPRNFGMNTTPENEKNFKQAGCRACWKINFQKSVRKNFQAKRPQVALRINLKKSVCQSVMPPLGGHPPPFWGVLPLCHATFWGVHNGGVIPTKVGYVCTPSVVCPHCRGGRF